MDERTSSPVISTDPRGWQRPPAEVVSRLTAMVRSSTDAPADAEPETMLYSGFTFVAAGSAGGGGALEPSWLTTGRPPLVVVSRVPPPPTAGNPGLGPTLLFLGYGPWWDRPARAAAPWRSLPLPGAVVGPASGALRSVDQEAEAALRGVGIRTSRRPEMTSWLTVTSAWLGPFRGAVVAASRQGLRLEDAPDLVTVAARATRERLTLMRAAGMALDVRGACLAHLPEWWVVDEVRRVAAALPDDDALPFLPTSEEAVRVSLDLAARFSGTGVRTPAADFLDGFCRDAVRAKAVH